MYSQRDSASLAVCAEEVPLGRLDSANQLGHLQRGHHQHSAAHHG